MVLNYQHLRRSTQAYRLSFNLQEYRNWQLADVNFDGSDGNLPVLDPVSPLGPANEFRQQNSVVDVFNGISDMNVVGSVDQGGFTTQLVVPQVPAEFADYFGVGINIETWHGNIPGVIGASGVDYDGVLLFQGYMRRGRSTANWGVKQSTFDVSQTTSFWQDSSFTRGIDFASGLAHGAPGTPGDVIRHLVDVHSNTSPRSVVGIYLPPHDLGTSYSLNKASLYQMVKQVADNVCLDRGWVYSDREDNIQVTGHPNLIGDHFINRYDYKIEYDDGLIIGWDSSDQPPRQCAQCSITMVHSDQTEEVINGYSSGGLGSRDPFTVRTDDINLVNELNARWIAHANRRYPQVRIQVPLNVVVDLGNMVLVTTQPRYNNRGLSWNSKEFVVTGIEYTIETQEQRFSSWVTLDEVI